jgi:hypothetical protein
MGGSARGGLACVQIDHWQGAAAACPRFDIPIGWLAIDLLRRDDALLYSQNPCVQGDRGVNTAVFCTVDL